MASLPNTDCLVVAAATPVTPGYRPNGRMLLEHCRALLEQGCDGIALFGTTGEGAEFSVEDRNAALDQILAGGIDPGRLIVSVGALSIPDIARLARHALDRKVDGLLLMPPCVYRVGITEEGTFRFYSAVIEETARADMRLYLYHFPDISGVPVTPRVIRRLEERYPGMIAGVKDSGGDLDFTEGLLRRFSHLSIYTGTEIHVPQATANGARGTICGLANVMPRLMRAMLDLSTPFERRQLIPHLVAGDSILSRRTFLASVKSVIAARSGSPEWRRVLPPLSELPMIEEQHTLRDFDRWELALPAADRSLQRDAAPADPKVVAIRRA